MATPQQKRSQSLSALPSVDRVLRWPAMRPHLERYGASRTTEAVREALENARERISAGAPAEDAASVETLVSAISTRLSQRFAPALRPVFNLTGTIVHTNLGRAPLSEEAIREMAVAAASPTNLEFDLETGRRGDRDAVVEAQIRRLTGAEAATVVNNNAAAVLLVLNTLARRKEVIVSRGELVEIGGAFRIPEVMQRAGAKLREVGATNRTHERDYEAAIGDRTALLMKAHTSNYEIRGFVSAVSERALARIAHERGLPVVVDLGSGALADLAELGLPHEPTPSETLAAGVDLVTFSGDKLLGGPQAGVIAGRRDLVEKIKRNPMKRALRVDKIILAALSATLRAYERPETLRERLPIMRALTESPEVIAARAERLLPALRAALADVAEVETAPCRSQIGSGALPVDLLPSAALAIRPFGGRRRRGKAQQLAKAFRRLPTPAIGRIAEGVLLFDLRGLEDEDRFIDQLSGLDLSDLFDPSSPSDLAP